MKKGTSQDQKFYDILVISDDVVGDKMAGPGIRAWEISQCLAQNFNVVLAIPDYSPINLEGKEFPFDLILYSLSQASRLKKVAQRSRIILIQGYILSKFPFLKELPAYLIIDLYVPFPLENLFVHKWKLKSREEREFIHKNDLRVFNEQILYGDHFLCASQRQRDLFLGAFLSLNRINPETLDNDPDLRNLISVVPFGLTEDKKVNREIEYIQQKEREEAELPQNENAFKFNEEMDYEISDHRLAVEKDGENKNNPVPRNALGPIRQYFPQTGSEDIVLIWGGVITNWFDPLTLLKAVKKVASVEPRVKLFFLSTGHPNPLLPEFEMAREAISLAKKLELLDRFVFFHEEWVDYQRRGDYFRDADIGVSIHRIHFETYFSFRTRILDYFKYELPIICTEGDYLAELIKEKNLGYVVPDGDEEFLAETILKLMNSPALRQEMKNNIQQIKPLFSWTKVTQPLLIYCQKALAGKVKKVGGKRVAEINTLFVKPKNYFREAGKKILGPLWMKMSTYPLLIKIRKYFGQ